MERQFLCHSVDVRMCSVKTKEVKRSHKQFQSGSCPLGGGNQSEEAHDFYHGFTCDGHLPSILVTCPKFDNLLPELGLSIGVLLC